MKVKTFIVGLVSGWSESFRTLDEFVQEELGTEIQIHSLKDTFYETSHDYHIARVIVYDDNPKKD